LADGENGLLLHCFGSCGFDEILAALVPYGLLDDDDAALMHCEERATRARSAGRDAYRIEHARHIYAETGAGSLVATYIYEARGISLLPPAVLREHLQCPHRLGIRLPAMVAPVVDVGGELTGIHATYLKRDGGGKADLGHPEYQRETRGRIKGGATRLAEHDPDRELLVGEGLESTLSAMEIYDLPGWAAFSADNLKNGLELPAAVHRIVIAADNDTAGRRAALEAHRRWTAGGHRAVRIVMPPRAGTDFNDLLTARG